MKTTLKAAPADPPSRTARAGGPGASLPWDPAKALCQRIIERDPGREDAHRRLMRCYPCANWAPTDPVTSGCTSRVRRHESVWKHPLRTSACPGVSVGAGPPRECSCAYGTTARHRCPSAEDPPVSGRVPVPVTAPAPPHEQHPPARNHGVGATGPASPSVRASRPPSLLAPRPCWRSSNSTPGAQGWNPTTRNTGAGALRIRAPVFRVVGFQPCAPGVLVELLQQGLGARSEGGRLALTDGEAGPVAPTPWFRAGGCCSCGGAGAVTGT